MRRVRSAGFTIVELLIVIVVIAILAAIVLVAYNGIQTRSKESRARTSVAQAATKVASYAVLNGDLYPADAASFFSALGTTSNSAKTYEYLVSPDRKHYCVSVYDTASPKISFASSDTTGEAVNGRCIRNYALNPSFEASQTSSIVDMGGANTDSSRTATSAWAAAGANASIVTKTVISGYPPKGTRVNTVPSLVAGDVINWMYTIKNDTGAARGYYGYGERGSPTYAGFSGSACQSVPAGATLTIRSGYTVTSGTEGVLGVGSLSCAPNAAMSIGESYTIDAYVITVNQPLPLAYADGNSTGWAWDGAANLSSSFGPAVLE